MTAVAALVVGIGTVMPVGQQLVLGQPMGRRLASPEIVVAGLVGGELTDRACDPQEAVSHPVPIRS